MQPKSFRTTIKDIPTVPEDVVIGSSDRQLLAGAQKQTPPKNGQGGAEDGDVGQENGSEKRDSGATPGSPLSQSGAAISHNNGILLTRQSLKTYANDNHLIQYKYEAYGGSSLEIPKWVFLMEMILKYDR